MPLDPDKYGSTLLRWLFWFAIAVSALTAAYATLAARGLVYDGSFYLLTIAATRNVNLVEPARLSVQILQQLPAVVGARLGMVDLWNLSRLFSLGMYGWPILLTALCWFVLPHNQKSWIAGPLINLVFVIPAASFIGIGEGIVTSCLLWLAVLLAMFRLKQPAGGLAALVVTMACSVAHEAAVLCLLLIGWIAAAQLRQLRGLSRFLGALVTAVSLAGACYMLRWILFPRSTIERTDFLISLLGAFLGSLKTPNLPVLASLIAACFLPFAATARHKSALVAMCGSALVLGCGTLFAATPGEFASPGRFFATRALPVVVTTILAALFVFLRKREDSPAAFVTPGVIAILVALTLSQALMQVVETDLWRGYVRDLGVLVANRQGVISHEAALAALNGNENRFRRELLQSWSVQPLSVLLAPEGEVRSMVQPAATQRWVPYKPDNDSTLPHLPQLNWSHFRRQTALHQAWTGKNVIPILPI